MAAAVASAAPAAAGRLAVVTGANQGIGLATVAALAKADPKLTVLLCSRDAKKGETAVAELKLPNVKLLVLDVNDEKSISTTAAEVAKTYGGVDILLNNAGIAWKGNAFNEEVARTTIATNYYGVARMLKHWMPIVRKGGRVVNVSSVMGQKALKGMSAANSAKFLADDLTETQLNGYVESFIADVKAAPDAVDTKGWPKTTYGVSKAACTALTRVWAREWAAKDSSVLINCCCPGWVRTNMAGPKAEKSPEEGAETPVHLATLPAGAPTGKFWQNKAVSAFM